ncbi:hypothetical protein AAG906_019916 [Vitis piasezkii]
MCYSLVGLSCISSDFSLPNDAIIILTMAGNGLDGSAVHFHSRYGSSYLLIFAKTMSSMMREEGRGRDKESCSGWNGDGDGINSLAT